MLRFISVALLGLVALATVVGCSSNEATSDCGARDSQFATVATAANTCDPTAQTPCVAYPGSTSLLNPGCGFIGITPDAQGTLDSLRSAALDAGCSILNPPCAYVPTPTYSCQISDAGVGFCTATP